VAPRLLARGTPRASVCGVDGNVAGRDQDAAPWSGDAPSRTMAESRWRRHIHAELAVRSWVECTRWDVLGRGETQLRPFFAFVNLDIVTTSTYTHALTHAHTHTHTHIFAHPLTHTHTHLTHAHTHARTQASRQTRVTLLNLVLIQRRSLPARIYLRLWTGHTRTCLGA
jgi:hypothetical protein